MSSRPVGPAGLELIKRFEGCRLTAYKPVPNERYWTIGWGHYGPDVKPGMMISQDRADALLVQDCQGAADAVDRASNCPVMSVLNSNQRDALISFTFNCGAGCLRTLCRNRSLPEIAEALELYNRAGGAAMIGLTRRRAAERALFETPVKEKAETGVTYKTLQDVPAKFRPIIEQLMDAHIIQGDGSDPTGNGDVINLTHEQVRTLVFAYRGGAFDRCLLFQGMEPAVPG